MTVSPFERFAVRTPLREARRPEVKGRQWPPMTFMSNRQVPEADFHVELAWIYALPEPTSPTPEQILGHDQLLMHIGMDYRTPQVLGGTIEMSLRGQPIVFNTTTSVFIPKGTAYTAPTWKEFDRPHLQLSIVLGSGDPYGRIGQRADGSAAVSHGTAGDSPSGASVESAAVAPSTVRTFDYEQYVVRSPIREAGFDYVEGRQNPTMSFLSGKQIPGVTSYLEMGWVWDVPSCPVERMRHEDHDEIVLHIGSDPDHPEDLGATMRFDLGDDPVEFDTTHCVFVPRGLTHGPLTWKEVHRPMIELALIRGASTWAEGWEGSFLSQGS